MPNILHKPKFETIKCTVCGCIYEYEECDNINVLIDHFRTTSIYDKSDIITTMTLSCPVCGTGNKLYIVED